MRNIITDEKNRYYRIRSDTSDLKQLKIENLQENIK